MYRYYAPGTVVYSTWDRHLVNGTLGSWRWAGHSVDSVEVLERWALEVEKENGPNTAIFVPVELPK